MSVQYTRGCAVHQGMFSTLGGYEYIRGCSIQWGNTMSTVGDTMMGVGISRVHQRVFSTLGGYHDECQGIS